MRKMSLVLLALTLALPAPMAAAGNLVKEFKGSRSTQTPEFEVKAPWLIDWRVNSEYPNEMGISIALFKGGDDSYVGRVAKTKSPGDGLRLMNESGRFWFKVDAAVTDWTIRVEQLSEQEAERYTPTNPNPLQ